MRSRPRAALALVLMLSLLTACREPRKTLQVFAADALASTIHEMKNEFERLHPDTDIALNIHGSVLITRLLDDHKADVVALADHRLVEKVLNPKHATWVAKFASTEIVLAYTTASARRTEITPDNWFDILLRPDVRYGCANPTQDSCGYYTRLAWHLAERHYFTSRGQTRPLTQQLIAKCPPELVSRDANRLISDMLHQARVDYAFVYRVHATDQKLPFIPLPKEISLGDPALAATYAEAETLVPDYHGGTERMRGTYIAFGLTIPPDAPNPQGAQEFVRFLLSKQGQAMLRRSGFEAISPAIVPRWCTAPDFLKGLAVPER